MRASDINPTEGNSDAWEGKDEPLSVSAPPQVSHPFLGSVSGMYSSPVSQLNEVV